MAQAARLSMRMQKELKLLLSDPPPGASFPLLSAEANLSSIDADIEGPEGTVYSKGIFRVKIQIPERYPFQPPNVTLATPIYHPNIDNGGRICLDILNLPPKGSWQPSLNISTVLTSIGLLLGEPNPDDGLMCEASREYKYNRQAFDQKARSMTQKYAMGGASGNTSTEICAQLNSNPNKIEDADVLNEAPDEKEEMQPVQKTFWGRSRKLTLVSSTSIIKRDDNSDTKEMHNPLSFACCSEGNLSVEGTKVEKRDDKDTNTQGRLDTKRLLIDASHHSVNKSNSEVNKSDGSNSVNNSNSEVNKSDVSNSVNNSNSEVNKSDVSNSVNNSNSEVNKSDGSYSVNNSNSKVNKSDDSYSVNNSNSEVNKSDGSGMGCEQASSTARCRKLSLGKKGPTKKMESDNKENLFPVEKLQFSRAENASTGYGIAGKFCLSPSCDPQELSRNKSQRSHSGKGSRDRLMSEGADPHGTEEAKVDAVIVLDSEDSEDGERQPLHRRGVLRRKRLKNWNKNV
ncbi:hypothetical protein SAY87_029184 [Trapa incisa]|uniref:E2 ubiquitin-conjugating enzyme n=1 Tax=Trapa incisa TaxID=236973 RepID=A0AAN7KW89_9MYRT|nr:hypothetical protein SAY87_029184 [Trapa incisa]